MWKWDWKIVGQGLGWPKRRTVEGLSKLVQNISQSLIHPELRSILVKRKKDGLPLLGLLSYFFPQQEQALYLLRT